MKLNELPVVPPGRQDPKRKGQGVGSGNGKTAGKGQKGQRARSGGYHKVGFEGGQMPLQRRLPKRGFKSPFKKHYALIKVGDLSVFDAQTEINEEALRGKGLLPKRIIDGIKLLGDGEIDRAVTVVVHKASQSALDKIQAAGGRVTLLEAAEEGGQEAG